MNITTQRSQCDRWNCLFKAVLGGACDSEKGALVDAFQALALAGSSQLDFSPEGFGVTNCLVLNLIKARAYNMMSLSLCLYVQRVVFYCIYKIIKTFFVR